MVFGPEHFFFQNIILNQVDESSNDAPLREAETVPLVSPNSATNVAERAVEAEPHGPNQMYVSMAIVVLLLSLLASYLFNKNSIVSDVGI